MLQLILNPASLLSLFSCFSYTVPLFLELLLVKNKSFLNNGLRKHCSYLESGILIFSSLFIQEKILESCY